MSVMSRTLSLASLLVTLGACPIEYTVPLETDGQDDAGDEHDDDGESSDDCDEHLSSCDGRCVDPQTDPAHCGDCENSCGPGGTCVEAECFDPCNNTCDGITEVCVSGTCECRPGFDRCDGACVDLDIDATNCGECDETCTEVEEGEQELHLCELGECIEHDIPCSAGLTQCGQSCVDLQSHPLHCNACDRTCDADQVCIDGECLED